MEAAGIESAEQIVATVSCEPPCDKGSSGIAANVLHDGGTTCRCMTLSVRLRRILDALERLPEPSLQQVEALCLQPPSSNILPRAEVST